MAKRIHNIICLLLVMVLVLLPLQLVFAKSFGNDFGNAAGTDDMSQSVQHKDTSKVAGTDCESEDIASNPVEHTSHDCNDCNSCSHCEAGVSGLEADHHQVDSELQSVTLQNQYSIAQYPALKPPKLS